MNEVIDFIVEAFAASWIEIVMPGNCKYALLSKPLRLRGLKFLLQLYNHAFFSRSLCGFVDWNLFTSFLLVSCPCRSLCGFVDWNWMQGRKETWGPSSQPLRLRGLKFCPPFSRAVDTVEAFAASWIEIGKDGEQPAAEHTSKPLRLRGLKLPTLKYLWKIIRRSLCGFVDWNRWYNYRIIFIKGRSLCGFVDWNKTAGKDNIYDYGRSLCGFVDWNQYYGLIPPSQSRSKPLRLRGLKSLLHGYLYHPRLSKPLRLRGLK